MVLYLTYDGLTDPLGGSQILPYIIGISKISDLSFTVISCEKQEIYQSERTTIEQLIEPHDIRWIALPYHKSPSVLSTLFDLWQIWRCVNKLNKEVEIEIVHCRSYLTGLIGLWLKKKFGIKFIFDMRGFWADERVEGGIWNLKNPIYKFIYKFFKEKERELILNADQTIVLTNKASEIIKKWEILPNRSAISVIPCCADLELFEPANFDAKCRSDLRATLNIPDSAFILTYSGSLGTWYMVEEMVIFFAELIKKKEEAYFLFLTRDDPGQLYAYFRKYGISKERLAVQSLTRTAMPLYLSISDFSIYFIKPVFSKQASSPTKQAEIMALNIPIITNRGVGDVDLIEEENFGVLCDLTQKNWAIDGVGRLIQFQGTYNHTSRNLAEEHFSLNKGIESYLAIYQHHES